MVKAIIDGVTLYNVNSDGCYIASAVLSNNSGQNALEIGSTASDMLTITIANPFKESFDGSSVKLSWKDDEQIANRKDELIDEVGEETSEELVFDDNESDADEDDGTSGDDATSAEVSDAESEDEALESDFDSFLNGEETSETVTEEEPSEYESLGTFYVYSQTSNDGTITLICLDGFVKLSETYIPTNYVATPQQLWDDIKSKLEGTITVDDHSFSVTDSINWNTSCSYRDAIGYLAGLEGGYATFGSDETVGISFYTFGENIVLESEMTSCIYSASGETTIGGFRCNGLISGYGQMISFSNPFMTQSALDAILSRYNGVKYYGGSFTLPWEHGLQAGEFIRIMTDDEFRQYLRIQNAILESSDYDEITSLSYTSNSLGKIVLISKQTVTFSDFPTTSIESVGNTQTAVENPLPQPIAKAIANASATATNYITEDATGALVIANAVGSGNVRIDSDSVDIRKGSNILGTFGASGDYAGLYINNGNKQGNLTSVLCGVSRELTDDRRDISVMTPGSLEVTNNNETTEIIGGDITAKSLNVTGSITGNISTNFIVDTVPILSSKNITAEGYLEGTTRLTKAGYYPLGVVGTQVGTRYWVVNRAHISSPETGSGTLNWMVANHHSSAHSASATVRILWVKG